MDSRYILIPAIALLAFFLLTRTASARSISAYGAKPLSNGSKPPTAPAQTRARVPNISPLLDLIGRAEAGAAGYDAAYAGSPARPEKPISQMTVTEAKDYQAAMLASGSRSTAIGRYQFIRGTFNELVAQLGLSGRTKLSPATQNQMAMKLLEKRGLARFVAGQMTPQSFARALSQEWAGLPMDQSERSYYHGDRAGNRATVRYADVLAALSHIRA